MTLGDLEPAKACCDFEFILLTAVFTLIYDPGVETEFLGPARSEQTNESDALFIIEKAKPRTKARG